MQKKLLVLGAVLGMVALAGATSTASAAQVGQRGEREGTRGMMGGKMGLVERGVGVVGTVSAINGNTITLQNTMRRGVASTTVGATVTYTVDASSATIYKNSATSSVSNIAVGNRISVQGKVTGTSVVATTIHDGVGMMGRGGWNDDSSGAGFVGNGQPVVAGNITALTGSIFTLTTKNGVAYSVDATNAKFTKKGATSTVSALAVNDTVIVQGTVNGNSVLASNVIDRGTMPAPSANVNQGVGEKGKGFFGGIGAFFGRLFGF